MIYGVHVWMCLLLAVAASRPGDMSSFFLKAPKSVPRAGRAAPGDYEGFFLKTSKSVPRIGRRNGVQSNVLSNTQFQQSPFSENGYNTLEYGDDLYSRGQGKNNGWNWIRNNKEIYKNQIEDGIELYKDHLDNSLNYDNRPSDRLTPEQSEIPNEDFEKQ